MHTDCAVGHGYKYNNIHARYIGDNDHFAPPNRALAQYRAAAKDEDAWWDEDFANQDFIKYGKKQTSDVDIIIHARATNKVNSGIRNWHSNNWDELVRVLKDKGYSVGSMGQRHAAAHIENTYDLRGIGMGEICNYMASAKLCIGPSSGPMHLASLCATPHFVWSEVKNKHRYERHWNPHNVNVYGYWEGWEPTAAQVVLGVQEALQSETENPKEVEVGQ